MTRTPARTEGGHQNILKRSQRVPNLRAVRSILALIKRVARRTTDVETLLELGDLYGWTVHNNHMGKYADDQLVRLCVRRFFSTLQPEGRQKNNGSLHVISHAIAFGGHTKLMERLARFEVTRPSLLVARSSYTNYAANMPELFAEVTYNGTRSSAEAVQSIAHRCGAFERVIVHLTEHDFLTSVGLLVAKIVYGTRLLFLNHADHQFSYGRQIADCILQIGQHGVCLCSEHVPHVPSSFVGLPLDGQPTSIDPDHAGQSFTVFTSGASWKFRPALGLSLVPHLAQLLANVVHSRVVIVGVNPLRDRWWWPLKLRYGARVRLVKSLPYEGYLRLLTASSVVLDSYPFGGGTAFAESLWKGRYVFAVTAPHGGCSPTDMLRRSTLADLRPCLLASSDYLRELEACQRLLPTVHSESVVRERLLRTLGNEVVKTPDELTYMPDSRFMTNVWIAKGVVYLPRAIFGYKERATRSIIADISFRHFRRFALFSKFRAIGYLALSWTKSARSSKR